MRAFLRCRFVMTGIVLVGAGALLLCGLRLQADDKEQLPNTLTEQEKAAGWKLLFDGTTTKGWRAYRGKSMPDKWQVQDGALVLTKEAGKQGGDIVTDDQYDSFDLTFEWKISSGGNS